MKIMSDLPRENQLHRRAKALYQLGAKVMCMLGTAALESIRNILLIAGAR
jgi:hypothetical protein